ISGLRDLAAEGFSYEDMRSGLLSIDAEASEVRARLRMTAEWQRRQRRSVWLILAGVVMGPALIVLSLRSRTPRVGGGFMVSIPEVLAAAAGASLVIVTLVYAVATRGAGARLDQRIRQLWTGGIGRWLFERMARSVKARPAMRLVSAELGPLTLVESLHRDVRRDLGDINRVISSLVAANSDLVRRETSLASSEVDASRGSSGVATDTLDRVVTELAEARVAAIEKRAEITAALERLRLELIRLRSGVGTVEEVKAEVERARAMAS
ncbi:MAG: hypothetical protein ABIS03_07875, partial [Gemmatimonadaceae bacterium]